MAAQTRVYPSQSALGMCSAEDTGSSEGHWILQRMVWHVEIISGGISKALFTFPGHVLNHKQSSVGNQDVIESTMSNNSLIQAFDHLRKDGKAARWGLVCIVGADKDRPAALGPGHYWGIDGFLDVRPVEVDFGTGGEVIK